MSARGLPFGAKPFHTNEDDRGSCRLRQSEMPVKVVVERNANPVLSARNLQNLLVAGPLHTNLGHMNRVPTCCAQQTSGPRRQPLIEQHPSHATLLVNLISSSTEAAA